MQTMNMIHQDCPDSYYNNAKRRHKLQVRESAIRALHVSLETLPTKKPASQTRAFLILYQENPSCRSSEPHQGYRRTDQTCG